MTCTHDNTEGKASAPFRAKPDIWRAAGMALVLGVLVGVAEVVIRAISSGKTIVPAWLATAVYANVACLGLVALTVSLLGAGIDGILVRWPARRERKESGWVYFITFGAIVGLLVYVTEVIGLFQGGGALHAGISVGVGALATLMAWGQHCLGARRLSPMLVAAVVPVWLICSIATITTLRSTLARLDSWLTVDTGSEEPGSLDKPNIVLVVLDTLRADHVGVYSDDKLTPNLDRLAASSIVYTQAISTAPWTLPAHASLFTGMYPEQHGVSWGNYKLHDGSPSLAELLRQGGYDTFAVSNNSVLSADNGFARGFDAYLETDNDLDVTRWRIALKCGMPQALATWFGLPQDAPHDKGSAVTNCMLRERLTRQALVNRPFFAFVNYFEAHDPYEPPDRFVDRFLTPGQKEAYLKMRQHRDRLSAHTLGVPAVLDEEDVRLMSLLYRAEVAYQDEVVGELLNMLAEGGLMENTWIAILSDHGELFGEWGMVYHVATSHYRLIHVPLIVRPPAGVAPTRIESPVQPVDLFVTLVDAAGLRTPDSVKQAYRLPLDPNDPEQRTLCITQTHAAAISSLSVAQRIDPQLDLSKWLTWTTSVLHDGRLMEWDDTGPRSLYDVRDDPDMQDDLLGTLPDAEESLLRHFFSWRNQQDAGGYVWQGK